MAEPSQQNVVVHPQSADGPPSVDVSVNDPKVPAARAAVAEKPQTTTVSETEPTTVENSRTELGARSTETADISNSNANKANALIGEYKERDGAEDGSVKSVGMEGSVESDNDASKPESFNMASKDSEGQALKYSLKKSASFKPVSVTKNFLAKAGSGSTPAKPGSERASPAPGATPTPAVQNALRPRLVAKSASGQRGTIPKATMADKAGQGAGPDPNQVWNRNRVSAPQATGATPKHLTDEELRQQYGIQLASRPDDSDDKGAKWADIDDEEDDWAPEAIEWSDGTKINLAQDTPPIAPDGRASILEKEQEERGTIDKVGVGSAKSTTVGPNATVLKLGASSHQRPSSESGKGSMDKPTLVAKPAAPTPVKSPWAALPAVDKVSPVPINPPVQSAAPSRFGHRDLHGFDAMPPPPGPQAKEIAADDFSRFSRDAHNGVPRELFVPQSGRYEPVNESRRGSTRKDSFRQPSVLQRPSQNDLGGPAEPSAAFQTHRSQQESGSWSRRRASSTVSGESGKFGRRMSSSKNMDSPSAISRRNSQLDPFTPAVTASRGLQRDASPAQSQGKSMASQSPTMSAVHNMAPGTISRATNDEQQPPPAATATDVPQEDPIVVQKRLMREKREAAIQRKRDEESREEAERKERIRLKMEKLGLTDEKMGNKKPTAAPAPSVAKENEADQLGKDVAASVPDSPPKPPAPSATGPPQQYGLMKVHASQPVHVNTPHTITAAEQELLDTVTEGRPNRSSQSRSPFGNRDLKDSKLDANAGQATESRMSDAAADPRAWANTPQAQSSYPNWGNPASMTTHSTPGGNLWGPPSNHRALGNGDFQQSVQRTPLRPAQPPFSQHLTSPAPQPIGTPRQASQTRSTAHHTSSDILPRSFIEDSQTIPAFPPTEQDAMHIHNRLRVEHSPGFGGIEDTQRAAQPSSVTHALSQPSQPDRLQKGQNAWAQFSVNVTRTEREQIERAKEEHAARMAEQQLNGIVPPSQLPVLHETWKQVKRGDQHGTRQIVNQVKSRDNYAPAPQLPTVELPKASVPTTTVPPVRSRYSDFFGQDQHAANVSPGYRPQSPTAPPPDSFDHPAYVAVGIRPLVNLPGQKLRTEKPVVKLPPANSPYPNHAANVDAHVPPAWSRPQAQPIVSTSSWQDRISSLFGRKATSPKKSMIDMVPISAASKEPLELSTGGAQATSVTLPNAGSSQKAEGPLKTVEEENLLFEERDFGSLPTTRLPTIAPGHNAWHPAKEPVIPYKIAKNSALRDTQICSIPNVSPPYNEYFRGSSLNVAIFVPGMAEAKSVTLNRAQPSQTSRGGKAHSMRGKHRPGPKSSKESSSSQGGTKSPNNAGKSPAQTSGNFKPKTKSHAQHNAWAPVSVAQ